MREDALRGRHVWIGLDGHAAGDDAERYRDLYGAAAGSWVAAGALAHYVVVPAHTPTLDAWFRLGFGQQQAHALRPVDDPPDAPVGVEVRTADSDELGLLVGMGRLRRARAGAPAATTDWRVAKLLASRYWPRHGSGRPPTASSA